MFVILDPGHNGKVPGKCSPDRRFREYRWVRELTKIIEDKLDKLGIKHQRTTTPNEDEGPEVCLTKRCVRANAMGGENPIFISIHVNAAGSDGKWHNAQGWSVFVSPKGSKNSKKLATLMTGEARKTGIKVRVPKLGQEWWEGNFTVLNKTRMPAVLVENLFQDNEKDVEYLESEEGKDVLSDIIIKGILAYYENK